MLKNAKIRIKVTLAFGVIILLAAAIICWLLVEVSAVSGMTQQLYRGPYAANEDMWTIRRNLIDTERVLYRLASVGETARAQAVAMARDTLAQDAADIDTAVSQLELLFEEPEELQLLADVKSMLAESGPVRDEMLSLIASGRVEAAQELLASTYEPLFEQCNQQVLSLAAIAAKDAEDFAAGARASSSRALLLGIALLVGGFVTALIISTKFSHSIVRPLAQIESAAVEMSRGNLNAANQITYHSKNEIGQLADSLRFTMTTLSAYVDEISAILLRLAEGDLTASRAQITDFLGDFSEIKFSLVTILKSFNSTLGEINQSAQQVNSGSDQVSSAAQLLSEGATQQASAIEELTSTVEEISSQIRETADNAHNANALTGQVNLEVSESSRHMEEMNRAMAEISDSSQEIGKIIKAIEDIAFQTNILALNAAVEAARAGAAGKGFAVVADEVRNLASKSAEASKNTAALIESSIKAVENGTAMATATSQSLETVVSTTKQVVTTVERIAAASQRQAESVEEVTARVEQISSVVQTNSATAQQSAAASEELAGQAAQLNDLVGRFRLYEDAREPLHLS